MGNSFKKKFEKARRELIQELKEDINAGAVIDAEYWLKFDDMIQDIAHELCDWEGEEGHYCRKDIKYKLRKKVKNAYNSIMKGGVKAGAGTKGKEQVSRTLKRIR